MVVTSGRELVGIAVAGCDNHGSAFPLLLRRRGREKIVGLVTGGLCRREAASRHELRQDIQLLNQLIVEPASGLIALKRPVPVSRGIERVPADKGGARLFAFVEPEQKIGEPTIAPSPLSPALRMLFGTA